MFKVAELLKATQGRLITGQRDVCAAGVSIDSRTLKRGDAFLAIKGRNFDGHDFIADALKKGASCVITERRSAHRAQRRTPRLEVKDTTAALGDIARYHRNRFDIPVIAITGSNGKTTTKEMLAWVLGRKLRVLKNEGTQNNQIGLPLTILKLQKSHHAAVVEIGTNHFGEIQNLAGIAQPNIGVITNIGPSHLEFLKDLKGVFQEKYSLIENLKAPAVALLNADDQWLRPRAYSGAKRPFGLSFAIREAADLRPCRIRRLGRGLEFVLAREQRFLLDSTGYFNIYNALACIALARIFGMDYPEIIAALREFRFPEGRLNLFTLNRVSFLDDTYNSNPLSLAQALDALEKIRAKGRKIFVMGDMKELGEGEEAFHLEAGRLAQRVCDCFIAVGRLSALAAGVVRKKRSAVFTCADTKEARDILYQRLGVDAGDVVLVKGSRAMKMEEVLK
jgi:UDP-N-acetylmuramoyl-tripeptide--D-alanyl-D-alanine ligase